MRLMGDACGCACMHVCVCAHVRVCSCVHVGVVRARGCGLHLYCWISSKKSPSRVSSVGLRSLSRSLSLALSLTHTHTNTHSHTQSSCTPITLARRVAAQFTHNLPTRTGSQIRPCAQRRTG